MNIRDMTADDIDATLALNNANVPEVNELDRPELARLMHLAQSSGGCALVAELADGGGHDGGVRLAGFCLVYPPGQQYGSLNYAWFSRRYERFVYLDRIAVDARVRRSGAGRALYAAVVNRFAGVWPVLTCEVNIKPLNQTSLDFHERIGFVEVGQQDTSPAEDGSGIKRVSLLALDLGDS